MTSGISSAFQASEATTAITQADSSPRATSTQLPGQPTEQFELGEPSISNANQCAGETAVYPSGTKMYLTLISLLMASILCGLDVAILAVTIPSLTNAFHSLSDIGWYNAAYGLTGSALTFFWSKLYTIYDVKHCYLASMAVFEVGAAIATAAQTSSMFIVGRAVSGGGGAGMKVGIFTVLTHSLPLRKRPMWIGIIAWTQAAMMLLAPLLGGALIDSIGWRVCFAVNLPLGGLAMATVWWTFESPVLQEGEALGWIEKIRKLDPLGTMVFLPGIVCLMLALQWGGMTFGWADVRIMLLFVGFAVLSCVFAWLQWRAGDDAMVPLRVLRNRNVLGGAWFEACSDGAFAVTEYYISIYLQGVKGYSAFKSGYLGMPMVIGFSVASLIAGFGITFLGYYMPFLYATAILGPVASGILTTLDLDTHLPKVLALLAFLGVTVGLGIQGPITACNTCLPAADVPLGIGVCGFAVRLAGSLLVSTSATIFQNRLVGDIHEHAPGVNATVVSGAGLSAIREEIGQDRLRDVLLGYGEAVSQTLYLPVALTSLSIIGAAVMEWRSVKEKRE